MEIGKESFANKYSLLINIHANVSEYTSLHKKLIIYIS